MKFALIDDAGQLWHRLWSVRLSLLAGLVSAADAAWEVYVTGQSPAAVLVTMALSFGGALARLVAQPTLPGRCDG